MRAEAPQRMAAPVFPAFRWPQPHDEQLLQEEQELFMIRFNRYHLDNRLEILRISVQDWNISPHFRNISDLF
jgi:hypothetical protein